MKHSRLEIDRQVRGLQAMTDRVLDDTAHDLRIIKNTVTELKHCAPEDREETIDVALGLIAELIGSLE